MSEKDSFSISRKEDTKATKEKNISTKADTMPRKKGPQARVSLLSAARKTYQHNRLVLTIMLSLLSTMTFSRLSLQKKLQKIQKKLKTTATLSDPLSGTQSATLSSPLSSPLSGFQTSTAQISTQQTPTQQQTSTQQTAAKITADYWSQRNKLAKQRCALKGCDDYRNASNCKSSKSLAYTFSAKKLDDEREKSCREEEEAVRSNMEFLNSYQMRKRSLRSRPATLNMFSITPVDTQTQDKQPIPGIIPSSNESLKKSSTNQGPGSLTRSKTSRQDIIDFLNRNRDEDEDDSEEFGEIFNIWGDVEPEPEWVRAMEEKFTQNLRSLSADSDSNSSAANSSWDNTLAGKDSNSGWDNTLTRLARKNSDSSWASAFLANALKEMEEIEKNDNTVVPAASSQPPYVASAEAVVAGLQKSDKAEASEEESGDSEDSDSNELGDSNCKTVSKESESKAPVSESKPPKPPTPRSDAPKPTKPLTPTRPPPKQKLPKAVAVSPKTKKTAEKPATAETKPAATSPKETKPATSPKTRKIKEKSEKKDETEKKDEMMQRSPSKINLELDLPEEPKKEELKNSPSDDLSRLPMDSYIALKSEMKSEGSSSTLLSQSKAGEEGSSKSLQGTPTSSKSLRQEFRESRSEDVEFLSVAKCKISARNSPIDILLSTDSSDETKTPNSSETQISLNDIQSHFSREDGDITTSLQNLSQYNSDSDPDHSSSYPDPSALAGWSPSDALKIKSISPTENSNSASVTDCKTHNFRKKRAPAVTDIVFSEREERDFFQAPPCLSSPKISDIRMIQSLCGPDMPRKACPEGSMSVPSGSLTVRNSEISLSGPHHANESGPEPPHNINESGPGPHNINESLSGPGPHNINEPGPGPGPGPGPHEFKTISGSQTASGSQTDRTHYNGASTRVYSVNACRFYSGNASRRASANASLRASGNASPVNGSPVRLNRATSGHSSPVNLSPNLSPVNAGPQGVGSGSTNSRRRSRVFDMKDSAHNSRHKAFSAFIEADLIPVMSVVGNRAQVSNHAQVSSNAGLSNGMPNKDEENFQNFHSGRVSEKNEQDFHSSLNITASRRHSRTFCDCSDADSSAIDSSSSQTNTAPKDSEQCETISRRNSEQSATISRRNSKDYSSPKDFRIFESSQTNTSSAFSDSSATDSSAQTNTVTSRRHSRTFCDSSGTDSSSQQNSSSQADSSSQTDSSSTNFPTLRCPHSENQHLTNFPTPRCSHYENLNENENSSAAPDSNTSFLTKNDSESGLTRKRSVGGWSSQSMASSSSSKSASPFQGGGGASPRLARTDDSPRACVPGDPNFMNLNHNGSSPTDYSAYFWSSTTKRAEFAEKFNLAVKEFAGLFSLSKNYDKYGDRSSRLELKFGIPSTWQNEHWTTVVASDEFGKLNSVAKNAVVKSLKSACLSPTVVEGPSSRVGTPLTQQALTQGQGLSQNGPSDSETAKITKIKFPPLPDRMILNQKSTEECRISKSAESVCRPPNYSDLSNSSSMLQSCNEDSGFISDSLAKEHSFTSSVNSPSSSTGSREDPSNSFNRKHDSHTLRKRRSSTDNIGTPPSPGRRGPGSPRQGSPRGGHGSPRQGSPRQIIKGIHDPTNHRSQLEFVLPPILIGCYSSSFVGGNSVGGNHSGGHLSPKGGHGGQISPKRTEPKKPIESV